jgi:hypothetical protein
MPANSRRILQVVPHLPGTGDGVGDYALHLAKALAAQHGFETIFGVAKKTIVTEKDGFSVVSGLVDGFNLPVQEWDHVIVHYVNYGYQTRGLPFWLLELAEKLRSKGGGVLLTVFHELYASSPPWKSAFWLQPWQKRIARKLSQISDRRLVSNAAVFDQLERLDPGCEVSVQPIPSTFGEPFLTPDEISRREPHRWVICGGTALVERSLASFLKVSDLIPESAQPRELFLLGGEENRSVRSLLNAAKAFTINYRPEISIADASEILSTCSFGWIDYFEQPGPPTVVVLKSGSFAALCAHGVIPVFPYPGSAIYISDDYLPGPFFVNHDRHDLPRDRAETARAIYDWYHRRVAWEHLARGVSDALSLTK